MPARTSRRLVAGLLSLVLPGAGQLYVGARRRGLLLLAATAGLLVVLLALVASARGGAFDSLDLRLVGAVLGANLLLLAFRLFAVADAWRGGGALGLSVLVALVAAPHVAAAYVTVRGYDALDTVFADEEPRDVLPTHDGLFLEPEPVFLRPSVAYAAPAETPTGPAAEKPLARSVQVLETERAERPWTTVLLLGTDEGPGNWGARTDTIILAAIQHGTGRAAAFGVPRNLAQVPLDGKLKRFKQPLNALYGFARSQPALFPGGGDPGATALKQAVSRLLGVRVDYYALVNLRGFADVVDALGGVRIEVKERLVDSVTRPAWGEPKPRIDVRPGEVRRFYGREALAYVRSRKTSSDYTRMARQRCFLSALADQLDPVRVLRNFGSLAATVEENVATDVPLDRLPRLVRLVAGVRPAETLTVTFGPEYFFARRKTDNHPVPNGGKMRRTVKLALLDPDRLRAAGGGATASSAC